MSQELVHVEAQPLALRHELSVEEVLARIHKVHQTMDKAMHEGHHYGKIPGTDKPTLLKPGAELLNVMFRLDPQYATEDAADPDGHLTVTSTCTLWHIPTGQRWGSGQGSCSTRETKYAYRQAQRVCPACGKPAIIKGKEEYGGGWLCFRKKDGCGAKFKDGDAQIESQPAGRIANPDLPDTWNTVRKMANKRSLVAAVLNVTAASDIFTQDLEDAAPEDRAAPTPVVAHVSEAQAEEEGNRLFKDEPVGGEEAGPPAPELNESMRSILLDKINQFRNKKKISDDVFMGICAKFRLEVANLGKADPAVLNDIVNACARYKA